MTPLGSIMLSNVHRHISQRCWLQDNYTGVKGPKSHGIVKLFKGPSSSGSKKERGRDIISASRKKLNIPEIDIPNYDGIDSELVTYCSFSENTKCDEKNSSIDFDKTAADPELVDGLSISSSSSINLEDSSISNHQEIKLKDDDLYLENVEQDDSSSIDSKNFYQPSGQNEATDVRGL